MTFLLFFPSRLPSWITGKGEGRRRTDGKRGRGEREKGIRMGCGMMNLYLTNIIEVCVYVGGSDVLYNKFNVQGSAGPPVNPSYYTHSDYSCIVATEDYWRLSRCRGAMEEQHRVVCQSGWWLVHERRLRPNNDLKPLCKMVSSLMHEVINQTRIRSVERGICPIAVLNVTN